jgi:hypothetical protein
MPLPKHWRAFIASLNSSGVEYLVVGAVALAHHGFPRYTGDVGLKQSAAGGHQTEGPRSTRL